MNEETALGRPLVKLSDLPEGWRDIMHAIYADGGSDAEVKLALAIGESRAMSNDLFAALIKREPLFSEAVNEGRVLAEAWWVRKGKENLVLGPMAKFNATVYIYQMKNRFPHWKDRQEVAHTDPNGKPLQQSPAVQVIADKATVKAAVKELDEEV